MVLELIFGPATQIVLDSAIKKSYGDERKINWFKVYAAMSL